MSPIMYVCPTHTHPPSLPCPAQPRPAPPRPAPPRLRAYLTSPYLTVCCCLAITCHAMPLHAKRNTSPHFTSPHPTSRPCPGVPSGQAHHMTALPCPALPWPRVKRSEGMTLNTVLPCPALPWSQVKRSEGMTYNPQRSPAWTDRVLYRSNLPIKQVGLAAGVAEAVAECSTKLLPVWPCPSPHLPPRTPTHPRPATARPPALQHRPQTMISTEPYSRP